MTIEEKYKWNTGYTPFTIEEIRVLSAQHGMDITVAIGYNVKENTFSVITVGKNKELANKAVELSEKLMLVSNPNRTGEIEVLEDRRNEHTN